MNTLQVWAEKNFTMTAHNPFKKFVSNLLIESIETLVAEWLSQGDDRATGFFCADVGELEGVAVQGLRG